MRDGFDRSMGATAGDAVGEPIGPKLSAYRMEPHEQTRRGWRN